MAHQTWRTPGSRPTDDSPWMSLREDIAPLPNRRTTLCSVVGFGRGVGVLPSPDGDRILPVRAAQLRGGLG